MNNKAVSRIRKRMAGSILAAAVLIAAAVPSLQARA